MQHQLGGRTVELKRAIKKEEMAPGGYGQGMGGGGGYAAGAGGIPSVIVIALFIALKLRTAICPQFAISHSCVLPHYTLPGPSSTIRFQQATRCRLLIMLLLSPKLQATQKYVLEFLKCLRERAMQRVDMEGAVREAP